MRMRQALIGVVSAIVITGCASIENVHTNQTLLDEYRQLGSWSPDETDAKLKDLQEAYDRYPTDENRLRLAVVLGFGKGGNAEQDHALELFKDTVVSSPNSTTGTLSGIFIELLNTRKHLSGTRWALKKERQKVGSLEEKLEALTSIEKSLHHRD